MTELFKYSTEQLDTKIINAINLLQDFEPPEGYYLAFSGGKDSCVIKQLLIESGVKWDGHYNVTTIDPPELVYFIRKWHKDIIWEHPAAPFLKLLPLKGFPQRHRRWCCEIYKEHGGAGRRVVTGVRWQESTKRANRRKIESCYKDATKQYFNIIIDWTESEVWKFIKDRGLPYCSLYDEGFSRLGCIMCPVAGQHRVYEAGLYPGYRKAFIKAFEELHKNRMDKSTYQSDYIHRFKNGKEMFYKWLFENKREKVEEDNTVIYE